LCGVFLESIGEGNVFAALMDEVMSCRSASFARASDSRGQMSWRSDAVWMIRAAARLALRLPARLNILDIHDRKLSLAAGPAARLNRIPCVRHCHEVFGPGSTLRSTIARAEVSFTDRLVCISRYVQRTLPHSCERSPSSFATD